MPLVGSILTALGFAADSIAIAQAVRAHVGPQEDLFSTCFRLAVHRHRTHLLRLSDATNVDDIRVDEQALERVLSEFASHSDFCDAVTSSSARRDLAKHFRLAVIIPGHSLTDRQLDDEISRIVISAFEDFITRLPVEVSSTFHARDRDNAIIAGQLSDIRSQLLDIAKVVSSRSQYLDGTQIQNESFQEHFHNPFRIVKAEELDRDSDLLARLFDEPALYRQVQGPSNLVLEGGRGCGKSTILRSLSVRAAVQLASLRGTRKLTFRETGLQYFGVYVKLPRGLFNEWSPDVKLTLDAARTLFQHSFNMMLLKFFIKELVHARDTDLITLTSQAESVASGEVAGLISPEDKAASLSELSKLIAREERSVRNYIGSLRLGDGKQRAYEGEFTSVHDFLDQAMDAFRNAVEDLRGKRVFFLLDEYENLADFQQTVVNTIAKLRPHSLSLKIAARPMGIKSRTDLNGEEIQQPRDYEVLPLDYDVNDRHYRELLLSIARKRLRTGGFGSTHLDALLAEAPPFHTATREAVDDALAAMFGDVTDERHHQFDETLIFRLATSPRRPRTYAGFHDFVALSSGIISTFLELCRVTFYLAEGEGVDVRNGSRIPWPVQNEAAYRVSKAAIDYVHRIENDGPRLTRLVRDLADIFRARLLHHSSAPEAARVTIADPEKLDDEESEVLQSLIEEGVRWTVLHSPGPVGSYLPKHLTDVRSSEFYLNRIFAPALRISHKPRWRTTFTTHQLRALVADDTRKSTLSRLVRKHRSTDEDEGDDEGGKLF